MSTTPQPTLGSADPTGTGRQQSTATDALDTRWARVYEQVRQRVVGDPALSPTSNRGDAEQIADFEAFLEGVLDEEIINTLPPPRIRRGGHYSAPWIRESYVHGLELGDLHLERAGFDPPSSAPRNAIREDEHQNIVQRQYQQTFDDIAAAATDAKTDATRRYGGGLAAGAGTGALVSNPDSRRPEDDGVVQRLRKVGATNSKLAALWHIVETVNDAVVSRYESAGVTQVTGTIEIDSGVQLVESGDVYQDVQTAGDDRVCSECREIAASGPYRLEDIKRDRSLRPPYHPRCRCLLIPYPVSTF